MAEPDLETIALDCLARLEAEGDSALHAACAAHPDHADKLRAMVAQLRLMGLVEPGAEPAPERVGSYRLLRRIGAGGMGVVHLAEDERLGRRVALKVMRQAFLTDDRARVRFEREVAAVARLDHPGICTLYEAGELDGVPFLAMRLVEGETLAARVARWRGEQKGVTTTAGRAAAAERIRDVVRALASVAEAVHAAHENGVIHRDLKPDNIVFDQDDRPVVLDFGLARLLDAAQATLTKSGDRLGTPAYMAPEQVQGDAPSDARTDVYALGATLYEAVALRPPFDEARREVLYRRILTEEPPDPRGLEPQVGRDLGAVIQKAMSKEPKRRYGTAKELADDLRAVAAGEPVRARHPGPVARVVRWGKRNRAAAAVLMAVCAALAVSLVVLRQRAEAIAELEVVHILRLADEVRGDDPLLAYKYAREALERDVGAKRPEVVARMQEILFELPDVREIGRLEGTISKVYWTPDGQALLALGQTVPAALFGVDGALRTRFERVFTRGAWHPDGTQLALASEGFRTKPGDDGMVWPVELLAYRGGRIVTPGRPLMHDDAVLGLVWAEDGRLLATHERGATLWFPDGRRVWLDHRCLGDFWQGGFLPDGRIVAAGAIWSPSGTEHVPLEPQGLGEDHVYKAVVGDGFFVTGQGTEFVTRRAQWWDFGGGPLRSVDALGADSRTSLSSFTISPDGRRTLIGSYGGTFWLDAGDAGVQRGHLSSRRTIMAAAFHAGGVLVSDWSGAVHLFDDELRLEATRRVRGGIYDLQVDPRDGTRFVTASTDGLVRLWSTGPRPGAPFLAVTDARVAVDGRGRRLVAGDDGIVRLFDGEGHLVKQKGIPVGYAFPAFTPDGRCAVITCFDGSVLVWDLESDTLRERCRLAQTCEGPALFFDDEVLLQAGRWVFRFALDDDAEPATDVIAPAVQSLALDRDRGVLFAGRWEGLVQVVDLRGARRTETLRHVESKKPIVALAVSSGGDRVLAGCGDFNVYLLDARDGRELAVLGGHRHGLFHVSFGPGDRTAATVAMDGQVRIFDLPGDDVPAGNLWPRLTLEHEQATSAHFLGPDRLLVTGVRSTAFWSLTRDDLLRREPGFGVTERLTAGEEDQLQRLLRGQESR